MNKPKEKQKQKGYWLFLDDLRMPEHAFHLIGDRRLLQNDDWVQVRDYREFREALQEFGIPSLVSYDHDLAHEHYHPAMFDPSPERYDTLYPSFVEPTGLECMKYLNQFWSSNSTLAYPETLIHTQNPVGARNLINLMTYFVNNKLNQISGNNDDK